METDSYKETEKYWDDFADFYMNVGDMNQSVLSLSMISMLKIENCKRILEVGAGTSFLIPHII
jgi:protein-L-isoaspartate O-methyltransferase